VPVWKLEHVVWKDQSAIRSYVSLRELVCTYIGSLVPGCLFVDLRFRLVPRPAG
jgi:hypothetical protein